VKSAFDPDALFRAHHLAAHAPAVVGQSLEAASQVATSRREFLEFAEWRFCDLLARFSESFDDSCRRIGEPFLKAACSGSA
jgi:hypothetical protein